MSQSFQEIFDAQTRLVTDKWEGYFPVYDAALAPYRDRDVSVLEIGIQNGGSLEVHARYFRNHKIIVGCDIDPRCDALTYPDYEKIKVVVGDANAGHTRNRIAALSNEFDIIIDDGSHTCNDIILTFLHYFPLLSQDGLFVVEDLCTSYWQEFQGGLFHPSSSMAFLKDLSDLVNFEHWGVPLTAQQFLSARHPNYSPIIANSDLSGIHSVQFFNSMCVITKQPKDIAARLGRRRVRGSQATVHPVISSLDKTTLTVPNQRHNSWSAPG
jgi:hypothetical protein